jgi:hypothetical protein
VPALSSLAAWPPKRLSHAVNAPGQDGPRPRLHSSRPPLLSPPRRPLIPGFTTPVLRGLASVPCCPYADSGSPSLWQLATPVPHPASRKSEGGRWGTRLPYGGELHQVPECESEIPLPKRLPLLYDPPRGMNPPGCDSYRNGVCRGHRDFCRSACPQAGRSGTLRGGDSDATPLDR